MLEVHLSELRILEVHIGGSFKYTSFLLPASETYTPITSPFGKI